MQIFVCSSTFKCNQPESGHGLPVAGRSKPPFGGSFGSRQGPLHVVGRVDFRVHTEDHLNQFLRVFSEPEGDLERPDEGLIRRCQIGSVQSRHGDRVQQNKPGRVLEGTSGYQVDILSCIPAHTYNMAVLMKLRIKPLQNSLTELTTLYVTGWIGENVYGKLKLLRQIVIPRHWMGWAIDGPACRLEVCDIYTMPKLMQCIKSSDSCRLHDNTYKLYISYYLEISCQPTFPKFEAFFGHSRNKISVDNRK